MPPSLTGACACLIEALSPRPTRPQMRALVYSEIYLLPELAASAIEKWEAQLELSRSIGDADGVKRALTWLNKPDNRAISRIEKDFAFLDKTARCTSPRHFDKQILALAKP